MTAPKQNTRLRGITMTDANAMAVLEGRKWQTRRLIKMPHDEIEHKYIQVLAPGEIIAWTSEPPQVAKDFYKIGDGITCPYRPGDTLYVRETHFLFGHWERNGITKTGRQKWKFVEEGWRPPIFEVDRHTIYRKSMDREGPQYPHLYKRLARFMPRKYARTFRTVKAVRAERLQEISEADAVAEGVLFIQDGGNHGPIWEFQGYWDYGNTIGENLFKTARESYASLWQSIHGPGSVELNPWVWVIEFEQTPPAP